jgi:glycosyltransferase involved in cell wall biosynthesis
MIVRDPEKSLRILQVVGTMDTGGRETWLMNVLRRIDRSRYAFDFLTHTDKACFYDNEIRSLGGRLLLCPGRNHLWKYMKNLRRILKESGPFDVVHSHLHHFSGIPLMVASYVGVPGRIAHSHNDITFAEKDADFKRRFYLRATEWLIHRYATAGLACSGLAAKSLFGRGWRGDPRWGIFYCSIELESFVGSVDRNDVRREFGIGPGELVLGHVGRFSRQKNHDFLIDIFAEVLRRRPESRLVLVGEGPLRPVIEEKAARLKFSTRVIFAGVRPDVPRLMKGLMDSVVLPSHHEGLPLVLLEAQAAGLPCVYADNITREVDVLPTLMYRFPLERSAGDWADAVLSAVGKLVPPADRDPEIMRTTGFNIDVGVRMLEKIYNSSREGRPG